MWLLVVIVLVVLLALVAIGASAGGKAWGPLLLGLGFAGWGALLLLGGNRSPWPEVGLLYLCGSLAEFAAAGEFWRRSGARKGPSPGWRVWAALLGVAGSLGFVLSIFFAVISFVAWVSHPV